MENQLAKIVTESGLEQTKAQVILTNFQNYFDIASEWDAKVSSLNVTDVSQVTEMKMAREARLFLKAKRIDVENTRKQLKEQSLREGQTIDHIAGILKNLIIPIEEKAEQIEKFKELKEAAELAQRTSERIELLIPFNVAVDSNFIGSMPEQAFQAYLTGLKVEKEQREEAERKAEEERIAKEKAEAERKARFEVRNKELSIYWATMPAKYVNVNYTDLSEDEYQDMLTDAKNAKQAEAEKQAKIKAENERLQKEAEEKEKALEIERKKQAEELAKQKAEADKKAKEEAEKQAKIQADLNAKLEAERKANEAKLKAEFEEKLRIQKELDAKKKAEQEAIDKEIAEQKARLKAEKEAAKAPDKEKLSKWVDAFEIYEAKVTTQEGYEVEKVIREKFNAFKLWAKTQIENI